MKILQASCAFGAITHAWPAWLEPPVQHATTFITVCLTHPTHSVNVLQSATLTITLNPCARLVTSSAYLVRLQPRHANPALQPQTDSSKSISAIVWMVILIMGLWPVQNAVTSVWHAKVLPTIAQLVRLRLWEPPNLPVLARSDSLMTVLTLYARHAITDACRAQIFLHATVVILQSTELSIRPQWCAIVCQFTMIKLTHQFVFHAHSVAWLAHIQLYAWHARQPERIKMVFVSATSSVMKIFLLLNVQHAITVARHAQIPLSVLHVRYWWADPSTQRQGSAVASKDFTIQNCSNSCA